MPAAPIASADTWRESFNKQLYIHRRKNGGYYSKVKVLSIYWKDGGLGYIDEAQKINELFSKRFGYQVELYGIPSERAEANLKSRIDELLKDDEPDSLFIVYYGGHGDPDEGDEKRRSVWAASQETGPTLNWYYIQPLLKKAKADILLILDCCYAAQAGRDRPTKKFQLLAASAMGVETPIAGPGSFTTLLIQQICYLLERNGSVSLPKLQRRLVKRKAKLVQTPVHICLSACEDMPMVLRPLLNLTDINPPQNVVNMGPSATFTMEISMSIDVETLARVATLLGAAPVSDIFCSKITINNEGGRAHNPTRTVASSPPSPSLSLSPLPTSPLSNAPIAPPATRSTLSGRAIPRLSAPHTGNHARASTATSSQASSSNLSSLVNLRCRL